MKYLCIHGHFYQPPRENAWLETIELQKEAAPFHNWNERINFECYAPNANARILDDTGYITQISNNYSHISFNFGPTLLRWMEKADPATYRSILKADEESKFRFSGHGSAMAQVYSHLIMPLADRQDKETQVVWGIADFEYRFGRKPEGMWLAETAVDTDTLEVLAAHGIKYTVLAPRQAKAIRKPGTDWQQVSEVTLDTKKPYLYKLPSGKEIALFFYNGEVSQEVAFKGLLNSGVHFAERLISCFDEDDYPQLVHIATDGESYGHHHRFGEMALANAIRYVQENHDVKLTNYGEYLDLFPPTEEVKIYEKSSWSCVHGVERWRSDCGCNTGKMGWHQKWRGPLRDALDHLRDSIRMIYETKSKEWTTNPSQARNDYIHVILHRNEENVAAFFKKHFPDISTAKERTTILRLMEMQRYAILMYTSCGWFFDEISGIETLQILQYALRAISFVEIGEREKLKKNFLVEMAKVPGNVYSDGREVIFKKVQPSAVDLERVAMHFAAASLFEDNLEDLKLYNYRVNSRNFQKITQGYFRIVSGCSTIESIITNAKKDFSFGVLYLGQQQIFGSVSLNLPDETFEKMQSAMHRAFRETNLTKVLCMIQDYFGGCNFSFSQLFLDEKHKILNQLTAQSLERVDSDFREMVNDNYQLMTEMMQNDIPLPESYKSALSYVLNKDIREFIENQSLQLSTLNHLANEFEKWKVSLTNRDEFRLAAGNRIHLEINKLQGGEESLTSISTVTSIISILEKMGLELDLWKAQNSFLWYVEKRKTQGPIEAVLLTRLEALSERLKVRL